MGFTAVMSLILCPKSRQYGDNRVSPEFGAYAHIIVVSEGLLEAPDNRIPLASRAVFRRPEAAVPLEADSSLSAPKTSANRAFRSSIALSRRSLSLRASYSILPPGWVSVDQSTS